MSAPHPLGARTFTVEIGEGEDGYVVAACNEIPGCASQGKTREEALANITEAIEECLEVMWEDWYAQAEQSATSTLHGERIRVEVNPPKLVRPAGV